MMIRKIHISTCLLAVLVLALCGCSKSFKIKGNVGGIGNQNVRIVYATPTGVTERWTTAKENRFEVEGETEEPALVTLYDSRNNMLVRFWLESGDVMKVRGGKPDPYVLDVEGTDVNERWYDFVRAHVKQYSAPDPKDLNSAVEEYAKSHPDDLLSTLLLLCDYRPAAGIAQVTPLLEKLKPEAKPAPLLAACRYMMEASASKPTQMQSLLLYESRGGFASFVPTAARASLLYLWTKQTSTLAADAQVLTAAATDGAQMADVLMDADSMSWANLRHQHFGAWSNHYWAPQGPMDASLKNLKVSVAPTVLVADSLGRVTYFGADVAQAVQALNKLIR